MLSPTIKYFRFICCITFLLFLFNPVIYSQKNFTVTYLIQGKDSLNKVQQPALTTSFSNKSEADIYISQLPETLMNKGFATASVDSVIYEAGHANVKLYIGEQYKWVQIFTDSIDTKALDATGWNAKQFKNKNIDFKRLYAQEERIIEYYEDIGYPFAQVSLQHVDISNNMVKGDLIVNKGPLYHIDSVRIFGKAKIKNLFLQHYLDVSNNSIYNADKIKKIGTRIEQLPYLQQVQPSDVTMLGSGSVLNLYLAPKRSSEINVLVGFLPNTVTGKTQVTGDVHLNLKNALGQGENILVNWQQLQAQSPRLNLGYNHPYIFNSRYGIDATFDLLKRDSSYLQLDAIIGLQYLLSVSQTATIFYQSERSYLLSGGVDTNSVLLSKTLPPNIDVGSGNFGVSYSFINTNYRLNPRKGNELAITGAAGIKKVNRNNDIINLKDPSDPSFNYASLYDSIQLKSYRIKLQLAAAHYLPLGKASALKTAVNVGWYQSPQIFRNELFQIGGYRLLRGFDEESIYANKYAVATIEYHYLVGTNSYLFGFSDAALTQTKFESTKFSNQFISVGAGLAFETKFGLLNLSYAIGKRNDVKFDIANSSKIHFGYINYF